MQYTWSEWLGRFRKTSESRQGQVFGQSFWWLIHLLLALQHVQWTLQKSCSFTTDQQLWGDHRGYHVQQVLPQKVKTEFLATVIQRLQHRESRNVQLKALDVDTELDTSKNMSAGVEINSGCQGLIANVFILYYCANLKPKSVNLGTFSIFKESYTLMNFLWKEVVHKDNNIWLVFIDYVSMVNLNLL